MPSAAVKVDFLRHGRRVARTARAHTRSVGGRAADNSRLVARVRASGQGVRQNNLQLRRAYKFCSRPAVVNALPNRAYRGGSLNHERFHLIVLFTKLPAHFQGQHLDRI